MCASGTAASSSLQVTVTIDWKSCLLVRSAVVPVLPCALQQKKKREIVLDWKLTCFRPSQFYWEHTQFRASIAGFLVKVIENVKKKSDIVLKVQLFLWLCVLCPLNSNIAVFLFKWKKSIPKPFLCHLLWILTKHRAQGAGGEKEVILTTQNTVFPCTPQPPPYPACPAPLNSHYVSQSELLLSGPRQMEDCQRFTLWVWYSNHLHLQSWILPRGPRPYSMPCQWCLELEEREAEVQE